MLHFELVLFKNIFLEVCFHFLGALGKLMICFVSYGGFVNNEVFLKYFIENIMHGLMRFYCHDENKFISEMKEFRDKNLSGAGLLACLQSLATFFSLISS